MIPPIKLVNGSVLAVDTTISAFLARLRGSNADDTSLFALFATLAKEAGRDDLHAEFTRRVSPLWKVCPLFGFKGVGEFGPADASSRRLESAAEQLPTLTTLHQFLDWCRVVENGMWTARVILERLGSVDTKLVVHRSQECFWLQCSLDRMFSTRIRLAHHNA